MMVFCKSKRDKVKKTTILIFTTLWEWDAPSSQGAPWQQCKADGIFRLVIRRGSNLNTWRHRRPPELLLHPYSCGKKMLYIIKIEYNKRVICYLISATLLAILQVSDFFRTKRFCLLVDGTSAVTRVWVSLSLVNATAVDVPSTTVKDKSNGVLQQRHFQTIIVHFLIYVINHCSTWSATMLRAKTGRCGNSQAKFSISSLANAYPSSLGKAAHLSLVKVATIYCSWW